MTVFYINILFCISINILLVEQLRLHLHFYSLRCQKEEYQLQHCFTKSNIKPRTATNTQHRRNTCG